MLEGIPLFPEQASTFAPEVDSLYFFVTAVTAFFAIAVVMFVIVFAIKYRDKTGEKVGSPLTGSLPLEIGWSLIPFLLAMVIFVWSTIVFVHSVRAPEQTALRRHCLDFPVPAALCCGSCAPFRMRR